MDGARFDKMTRALAAGATRRRVLVAAVGMVGAALTGGIRFEQTVRAQSFCGVACAATGTNCNGEDACSTCCGGVCVDLGYDPNNCDDCGRVCPGGPHAVCEDGICRLRCPAGWTNCTTYCADTFNDPNNCFGCGVACPAGHLCCPGVGCADPATDDFQCGACGIACTVNQTCCAGVCSDTSIDPANCGVCGTRCGAGEPCEGGVCMTTATVTPSCPDGRATCPDGCVDLTTDPNNCGACGVVCSAATTCLNGRCVESECREGQTPCRGDCVDLMTDTNHCGACDSTCPNGEMCSDGRCRVCERSVTCDGECCNGECHDLTSDPAHCGECGAACPPGFLCEDGVCILRETGAAVLSSWQTAAPALCITEPRSIQALQSLTQLEPPVSRQDQTWNQITNGVAPNFMRAASPEVRTEIEERVVERSACGNANDPLRETALMTDRTAYTVLVDRGLIGSKLDQVLLNPQPLPPRSWEAITGIDEVLDLRRDRASAVVTYASRIMGIPDRKEVQIFVKDADRWLLERVFPIDPPSPETIVHVRVFDCPPGVRADEDMDACQPASEMPFECALTGDDGTVYGLSQAEFVETGRFTWSGLPPMTYRLEATIAGWSSASLVVAGARRLGDTSFEFTIGQTTSHLNIDVYYQKRVITDTLVRLNRLRAVDNIPCPPCTVRDSSNGSCVDVCPPCSICSTNRLPSGIEVASCVSLCRHDQECIDGRCCASSPGAACAQDADCCFGRCIDGQCPTCIEAGTQCSPSLSCCHLTSCLDGFCAECLPLDHPCENDSECCSRSCANGTCRCCSGACATSQHPGYPTRQYDSTGLCCEYPQVALCVPDGPWGTGFARCCTLGIDCVDDPYGPASSAAIAQARAAICTV